MNAHDTLAAYASTIAKDYSVTLEEARWMMSEDVASVALDCELSRAEVDAWLEQFRLEALAIGAAHEAGWRGEDSLEGDIARMRAFRALRKAAPDVSTHQLDRALDRVEVSR